MDEGSDGVDACHVRDVRIRGRLIPRPDSTIRSAHRDSADWTLELSPSGSRVARRAIDSKLYEKRAGGSVPSLLGSGEIVHRFTIVSPTFAVYIYICMYLSLCLFLS